MAAASRLAGVSVPEFCGPTVGDYLHARGAGVRPEHSAAYPIHLRDVIEAEPPRDSDEWHTWAATVILSAFCLRPGIPAKLTAEMFFRWGGGRVFVWRFVSKRAGGDALDDTLQCNVPHVSAARFPGLDAIFVRLPKAGLLFPNLTSTKLNAFVRSVIGTTRVPAKFTPRAHGVRVGADIECRELRVPSDVVNVLFWWSRVKKSTAFYYSGVNISTMMRVCEARASQVTVRHLAPGRYDARVSGAIPDWRVAPEPDAAPLPDIEAVIHDIDAAWAAELRQTEPPAPVRVRSPGAPASDDAPLPDAPPVVEGPEPESDFSADCEGPGCDAHVAVGDDAALCNAKGCRWLLCRQCHPDRRRNAWCPQHRPSAAAGPRPPRASGAGDRS